MTTPLVAQCLPVFIFIVVSIECVCVLSLLDGKCRIKVANYKEKMLECRESNSESRMTTGLQSADLANLPSLQCAEDTGIEPWRYRPLRFSRPLVPMHATFLKEAGTGIEPA